MSASFESSVIRLLSLVVVLFAGMAGAAEPMEDVDYQLLDPPRASAQDQIEVIEFFYYGCQACARLEPLLDDWLSRKPPDVSFRRTPALRRTDWIPLTRIFFALDELGLLPRLHAHVYRAIHEEGRDLKSRTEAVKWAVSEGADGARFEQALLADSVAIKVQKARDLTIDYGVRSTPTLVVDGRYATSAELLGDIAALLPIVDGLIEKARRARSSGR
jgi:protein dithiol oxidoreductase (disulfide-forming)